MSLNCSLLDSSLIRATRNQISSELSGEAVILNLKSGVYYGLNPVGARIWTLIQDPRTVATIRATLLEEYDVEADVCDRDLQAILRELAAQELIEISHEAAV